MNKFIKLNMYKVEFVSNSEGAMVGHEIEETQEIYIAIDKIIGIKPNLLDNGKYDSYVFVLDFSEPVHVSDTYEEILNLIPRD